MDNLFIFLKIIAWILGISSTIIGLLKLYMLFTYDGSNLQILDNLKGYNREFQPARNLIIAVVCWAFIIAFW